MIPLKAENSSHSVSFINMTLILTNIIVFIYQHFFVAGGSERLFYQLGCIPYEFSHFIDIHPPSLVPVPFTMLTSMFMHGGWTHILSNMLFLWIFGDNIEDILGHFRYLWFYILCGFAASLLHILTNINSQIPSVGASGAIAGVMGAYIFMFPMVRIKTLLILGIFIHVARIPAVFILGYWMLIQFLSAFAELGGGVGSGIAWFAHIGGFVSGFFLIIKMKKRRGRSYLGR